MNYADIVKQKYPAYQLTRVGSGNIYEDLEWSVFNPAPNPIPKATLDADIALFASQGYVGAVGDLAPEQANELVAFAQLPSGPGLVYKVDTKTYKLDTSAYLTSITSGQVITALGYTPYDEANPANYATVSYVDSVASGGIRWVAAAHDINLIGGTATPPSTPTIGDTYIIYTGGNTGAWSAFNVGDVVQYKSTGWVELIDVAALAVGDRFVISGVTATTAVGFAVGRENQIGTITGGVGSGGENINWSWETPLNGTAIFSINQTSLYFGSAYLYSSTDMLWSLFQATSAYTASNGLTLTGNAFSVSEGAGLKFLSGALTADVYPTGGIMTTTDGTNSVQTPTSQLSLTQTGIVPGTYKSVTVDQHGRLTAGTNPTTLAGYGILDAQPLDADLSAIAALSPTSGYLRKTGTNTWALDNSSFLPVTIINPQVGESIYYNGSSWINYGTPGGAGGGGAAKRIWSNNISASSGTTIITPGTTAPLNTQGTELWSQTFVPLSTNVTYVIQTAVTAAGSSNNQFITIACFRTVGGVSTFVGGTLQIVQSSNNSATLSFALTDKPNTTQPVTYSVRVGINSGTWFVNRRPGEVTYGGTQTGWVISEY